MLQDSFTPPQLQSLIEKYRKELLKAYGRQTVNGAEAGALEKSAAKNQSEISDSQNTADATAAVAPLWMMAMTTPVRRRPSCRLWRRRQGG